MKTSAMLCVAAALAVGSLAVAAQSGDAPYLLPGPGLSVFCQDGSVQFFEGGVRVRACIVSRDVNLRDTGNAPVVCSAGMTAQFNDRGYLLSCGRPGPDAAAPSNGGIFGPARPVPPSTVGGGQRFPGWAVVCESAMTAILRSHQASFGPQAAVRVQWVRPLTFDGNSGECVGGFRVYVRRPGDVSEWIALEWNADFGAGRMPATTLVQQYRPNNPDLPWGPGETPSSTGTTSVTSAVERGGVCKSAMVAMEREKQAQWGSDGRVRYEWIKPFTYDNGDCVGGYKVMIKRPSDKEEFCSLEWFADRGDGRVPASQLIAQYQQKYPDLSWVPAAR